MLNRSRLLDIVMFFNCLHNHITYQFIAPLSRLSVQTVTINLKTSLSNVDPFIAIEVYEGARGAAFLPQIGPFLPEIRSEKKEREKGKKKKKNRTRRSRWCAGNHRAVWTYFRENHVEQLFLCFYREFGKGVKFFFVNISFCRISSLLFQ